MEDNQLATFSTTSAASVSQVLQDVNHFATMGYSSGHGMRRSTTCSAAGQTYATYEKRRGGNDLALDKDSPKSGASSRSARIVTLPVPGLHRYYGRV
jgi:hypothetical protein